MSNQERKIGFYSITFKNDSNKELFFNKKKFINLLKFINNLSTKEKILPKDKYGKDKAIEMDSCNINNNKAEIVFKSCKYNHSPNYMSSEDGSERESDKKLHEGEKEKTHLCTSINDREALIFLEERKTGVSIAQLEYYLDTYMKRYLETINEPKDFTLLYGIIASEDFLETIDNLDRIRMADVYMDKGAMGSEMKSFVGKDIVKMRDNIIVTIKSEPRESLPKRTARNIYHNFTSEDTKINRIRIYGQDDDNNKVRLDTKIFKLTEYITAKLNDQGIVKTEPVLKQIMTVLENNLDKITGEIRY